MKRYEQFGRYKWEEETSKVAKELINQVMSKDDEVEVPKGLNTI